MERELSAEPARSWFLFVSAGRADGVAGGPEASPVCPACRSADLARDALRHACRSCRSVFPVEFGVPIYLRDLKRLYSPPVGIALLSKKVLRPYTSGQLMRTLSGKASRFNGRHVIVVGSGEIARFAEQVIRRESRASVHCTDDPSSPSTPARKGPAYHVLAVRPTEALLWVLRNWRLSAETLAGRIVFFPNGIVSTVLAATRELFMRMMMARVHGWRKSMAQLLSKSEVNA